MFSHLISGSSIEEKITTAIVFNEQYPESSILINNTKSDNDNMVIVTYDSDEQINGGNLLFVDLYNPGKIYSSTNLKDGLERFVRQYEVENFYFDIIFYHDSSSLAHYLAN